MMESGDPSRHREQNHGWCGNSRIGPLFSYKKGVDYEETSDPVAKGKESHLSMQKGIEL